MSPRTIFYLTLRYCFLYSRNAVRFVELIFWPALDLLVWGFLTVFLQRNTTGDFPQFISFLIGAMIFWDVLFRAQQGVAISFLEDVWTRNLLNIFVAPVRVAEYVAATFIVGVLRIAVTATILAAMAAGLYGFNLLDFHWALIPFFANLMLFGWSLGMVSMALILRWGQAAESLAWAVPFLIQPVSAVFYPVDVLPIWLRPVALSLPSTHVFEGMREVLKTGTIAWSSLGLALLLNLAFLAAASAFFIWMLERVRKRGLLTKIATQ